MVWRINKNGEREQIDNFFGRIWQDGRAWKLQMPGGIATFKTKRDAQKIQATIQ